MPTIERNERDAINLTIRYEEAGDGWVLATISDVPGAISQDRTRAEARANVIDALQTVLTPDDQLTGRAFQPTTSSDAFGIAAAVGIDETFEIAQQRRVFVNTVAE